MLRTFCHKNSNFVSDDILAPKDDSLAHLIKREQHLSLKVEGGTISASQEDAKILRFMRNLSQQSLRQYDVDVLVSELMTHRGDSPQKRHHTRSQQLISQIKIGNQRLRNAYGTDWTESR